MCSHILWFCQSVQLSLLYRVTSFIEFVYSTFTSPAFRQILLQKSIGVIPRLTYFLHCPNSQKPKEMMCFMKCFVMCCVLKNRGRNCSRWQNSDLFMQYLLYDSLFSDISRHCQTVVCAICWAFSFLQGLMFSLCRKQSIVTRAGGGRPVETSGLAFDK